MVTEQPKRTVEEEFKDDLLDVITIAEKLAPFCSTVEELIGMAKHALENDGQLRMILTLVQRR